MPNNINLEVQWTSCMISCTLSSRCQNTYTIYHSNKCENLSIQYQMPVCCRQPTQFDKTMRLPFCNDRSTTTNPESFYNRYHSTHVIYDSLQNSDKDLPCSHELKINYNIPTTDKNCYLAFVLDCRPPSSLCYAASYMYSSMPASSLASTERGNNCKI